MGQKKGVLWIQQRPDEFDPSEACNSKNLYPQFIKYFKPIKIVLFGGLSYPIFEGIAQNIDQSKKWNLRKIKIIYGIEKFLTKIHFIKPLFMITVAGKRLIK